MKDIGNHVKTEIINFLVEKYCYDFLVEKYCYVFKYVYFYSVNLE